jgi:hypothetical protein
MVVLIALGLSLGILLIVTMVAMTRYMLANPDDPLVPGDGSWSGSMGESTTAPAKAAPEQPRPEPVPVAPVARTASSVGVPLDDMPAEVIAELAERLRRDA